MKDPFNRPLLLKNSIQEYAWGSHTAIQELVGSPPTGKPWAELWLGAHPKSPSSVSFMGEWVSLDFLIEQYPVEILGKYIAKKFKNALPYLYKVLAADQPLSIQAHPSLKEAKEGFQRENQLKIPLNSSTRNYKDDRHKPECICALTEFSVLKGFRNPVSAAILMEALCPHGLSEEIKTLQSKQRNSLKTFFQSMLTLQDNKKYLVISEAIENAQKRKDKKDEYAWIVRLHEQYPNDIGIFAPAMLNLIKLMPGQALFLPSGELHSYLDGVGIELMANSDNVIRGGLTPKHVDVAELLHVLKFKETGFQILHPEAVSSGEARFPLSVEEFSLSLITVSSGITYFAPSAHSAEILLCTQGSANILFDMGNERFPIEKGVSVLIPASMAPYQIAGEAMLYKAGVPI